MLDKHINPKIFDKDVEQVPIRRGFGEGLVVAAEKDGNIVALCADLTDSTQMKVFRDMFPDRFIEIGIAEQNLASVASGMAAMGKVPVISSYAMFSPGRNWEQIRTTICYNNQKVIIAGSHAGISVGPDGGTHQALEDIALMNVIPNMTVVSPCDTIEAKKAIIALLGDDVKTPAYIRLAREKTPVITTEGSLFKLGKAKLLFDNGHAEAVVFACGALVHKALVVANELQKEGRLVNVVNIHTIKPLDVDMVVDQARICGAVVVVEEHQKFGGLGSVVAQCLSEKFPVPVAFVAVNDRFGQSGTPEELIQEYCLGINDIKQAIERVVERK